MGELTLEQKRALALARARIAAARASQQPQTAPIGMAETAGRGFVQGGTFGAGDEIVAGGVALRNELGNILGMEETFGSVDRPMGEVYDASLAHQRERLAAGRDQHPVTAYGSEIAGSLVPGIATGGTGTATTLGGRLAAGMGRGTGQGLVYGFNAGEDGILNRGKSGIVGGGLGGVAGAVAPLAGQGVRSLASYLGARRGANMMGMPRGAYSILDDVMQADDSLTGAGAQRIAAAGDDGMLADAGPMGRRVLDVAVQRSGEASRIASGAVDDRVTAAAARFNDTLDAAFGQPAPLRQMQTTLRTGTAAARGDAYDAAYAQVIDYASDAGRELERLIAERVPQSAIDRANALMRLEGRTSQQIMASVADDGTVTFLRLPDVRQIDYITRGLRDVAAEANGKGQIGGTTQLGLGYANLTREIRSLLSSDDLVPEYRVALSTAAEPAAANDALKFGYDALRTGITRGDVADQVRFMSPAELTHMAAGVRSYIDDALANTRAALTDPNIEAREAVKGLRELSSRAARAKVTSIIGQDAADTLFAEIDQITTAFELRAAVSNNSATFARTAMDKRIGARVKDGPINALRSGRPLDTARNAVAILGGRTTRDIDNLNDETMTALVNALTGERGKDALALLLRMQNARQMLQPTATSGRLTSALLRPLTAPLAGQGSEIVR